MSLNSQLHYAACEIRGSAERHRSMTGTELWLDPGGHGKPPKGDDS